MLVKRAYLNDGTSIAVCIGTDRHVYAIKRGPNAAVPTGWTDLDPDKPGRPGRQFTEIPSISTDGKEITVDATSAGTGSGVENFWTTFENVYVHATGRWSGWRDTGGRAAPYLPPQVPPR